MHIENQTEYKELDNLKWAEEPLTIHRRQDKANNQLVIFVHGLNGSRYGDNSTWGNFPKFVFEDIPQIDVGLYEYQTGLRRFKFWKSVSLKKEAITFAHIIRDLSDHYKTIILIGHSMGGLLCKAVICHLIHEHKEEVFRIGGLI